MLLKDKVAIITGGGSGVGRETAKLFAKEGAKVVIGEILEDRGDETVRIVQDLGGEILFVKTDVTRETDVRNLVQSAIETYGTLDIMYNNVGVASPRPPKPTWEYTDADWNRLLDINLWGIIYGCKHAIPVMLEKGAGVILNTGSIAGMVAWGGVPYGATKAAVIHLTKGLASELADKNIRVNCICPGVIDTNFGKEGPPPGPEAAEAMEAFARQAIPIGRSSQPQEIAQAALYLASDMSTYVTGAALVVDGGYSIR